MLTKSPTLSSFPLLPPALVLPLLLSFAFRDARARFSSRESDAGVLRPAARISAGLAVLRPLLLCAEPNSLKISELLAIVTLSNDHSVQNDRRVLDVCIGSLMARDLILYCDKGALG